MKLLRQKLLLLAACLCYLIPSKAQDQLLQHIPARTSQVVKIDLKNLWQFMKWEEIKQLSLFEKMHGLHIDGSEFNKIIKDPSLTGIDLEQPLYVFLQRGVSSETMELYSGITGRIKNLQQFTKWALEMNKTISLTKPGRVKTILNNKNGCIWDTEHFVIVNDKLNGYRNAINGTIFNSGSSQKKIGEPVFDEIARSFEEGATLPVLDTRMKELFTQTAPVMIWNRNSSFDKLFSLFNPAAMLSRTASEIKEENISTSILNFDNGRAYFTSRNYFDKRLDKLFSGANKAPFDAGLAAYINAEKLAGFATLKLNMRSLMQFMNELPDHEKMMEKITADGFKPAEFFSAFTGDLLVTMGIANKNEEAETPALVTAWKINDMTSAQSLMDRIKKNMADKEKKPVVLRLDVAKKLLVIASNDADADRFMNGAPPVQDKELLEQIAAHPFFLQVNATAMYNEMIRLNRPKEDKEQLIASAIGSLQQFKITAGKYEHGALLFDYELGFTNKEDNGFRQLVLFYDKMIGVMMEKNLSAEKEVMVMPKEEPVTNKQETGTYTIEPPREEVIVVEEQKLPPVAPSHPKAKLKKVTPAEAEKIIKKNKKNT